MQTTKKLKKFTSLGLTFSHSKRVIKLAWDTHKFYVITIFIMTVVSAIIPYLQLGIFGLIVDEVIGVIAQGGTELSNKLVQLLILEGGLFLLPLIVTDIDRSFESRFRLIFVKDVGLLFVKKLAEIDISTHERPSFNDTLNNANERGVSSIFQTWNHTQNFIRNIVGIAVAGIILFYVHWIFLVLALVGTVPVLFIEIRHGKRVYGIWDSDAETRRLFFDRRVHFSDLTHLIELKLFQAVDFFHKQISNLIGGFTEKQVEVEKKRLSSELLGSVIFSGTLIASVVLLIQFTISGTILVGTMTFVFGSIRGFQGTLTSFFKSLGSQEEVNRFTQGFFSVLDTKKEMVMSINPTPIEESRPPKIEFRNVWFKYPDTEEWVLEDFNLTIESGETLSIVGVNGAGKTTFVKLLNRFYDPTKGQILINGVDLRDVSIEDWRSMTAVLFQEYATYHFPIEQAIAIGRTSKPLNRALTREAAENSEAEGFIKKLNKGFDQMIGKRFKGGIQLSVGQNQRMALARVFYRNAHITILDEPTASIDAEAEEHIFQQISEKMREKTVITISHRFSTVKRSDKIAVIEGGKITEYGDHTHLILLNGTYAHLYNLQAKAYQD